MASELPSPRFTPQATPRSARAAADLAVATEEHACFCFDVLAAHFGLQPSPRTPFAAEVQCPLFVTWNKRAARGGQHQLRGCIGCLKPLPLSSLREYALTSSLHDRRFPPMEASELPRLQCTVQLLGRFEPCALYDWTVGVHGLTISFADVHGTPRSAVYLPDVIPEQGWSQTEAIDSLIRKSGCDQPITDALRAALDVCRFVSTKCHVSYDRWAALRTPPPPPPPPVVAAVVPMLVPPAPSPSLPALPDGWPPLPSAAPPPLQQQPPPVAVAGPAGPSGEETWRSEEVTARAPPPRPLGKPTQQI